MSRAPGRRAPPDYVRDGGAAAIGARLRRLSERVDGEARRLHANAGLKFEQRWLGVLDLLSGHGPMAVGELALSLGISHPSVSQTRQSLAKAGLIAWESDGEDGRRRLLRLTGEGERLVRRLRPLWLALDSAAIELESEAGGVLAALERLEAALGRRSLYDRVSERIEPPAR